jgi:hypothetical protein
MEMLDSMYVKYLKLEKVTRINHSKRPCPFESHIQHLFNSCQGHFVYDHDNTRREGMKLLAVLFPGTELVTKCLLRQPRFHRPFFNLYRSGRRRARRLRHHRDRVPCDRRRALARSALHEVRVQTPTRERDRIFRRVEIAASATHALHERHNHEEFANDQSSRAPSVTAYATRESEKNKNKNRTNESMKRAPCCVGIKPFDCLSFVLFLAPLSAPPFNDAPRKRMTDRT